MKPAETARVEVFVITVQEHAIAFEDTMELNANFKLSLVEI